MLVPHKMHCNTKARVHLVLAPVHLVLDSCKEHYDEGGGAPILEIVHCLMLSKLLYSKTEVHSLNPHTQFVQFYIAL